MTSTKNLFTSLISPKLAMNDRSFSAYDYNYDNTESSNTSSGNAGGPQHLALLLQHLFSKMSDNRTSYKTPLRTPLMNSSSSTFPSNSLFSYEPILPSSRTNAESYYLLPFISLWFVLIINPIVIIFGVTGNLLATYILIRCNIAKLPVSFYTIMLNISDTLNLLIPVFIFWLDNCINRTPERGYFRDRSNFLCKALMCPDQLFAALSAWYMCAISFNRWYSVCRPSSYFFRTATTNLFSNISTGLTSSGNDSNRYGQKKYSTCSTNQISSKFSSYSFPWNGCWGLKNNTKYRRHLQAFRSIALITLMGFLFCLYPIFMHELRPIISTNEHIFDLKKKITHTYTVVYKRCYYSLKHKYTYDIIGIILSCLLHILPLTFVAAMNLMIIIRLRQRQKLMTTSAHALPPQTVPNKQKKPLIESKTRRSLYTNETSFEKPHRKISVQSVLHTTRKDQSTSTDLPFHPTAAQLTIPLSSIPPKRHYSRDRTITIMLVSVALSYLILTLPYRLFWSYNVYIKRMHPEKLKSSIYLVKMHYIDHVLRTIRNIHYGTNFVFFIFLSRTFRRKFRQIFIEKVLQKIHRILHRQTSKADPQQIPDLKTHRQRRKTSKHQFTQPPEPCSRSVFHETPSLNADVPLPEDEITPIMELEHSNASRYDGE